jgi:hypothetical protein
VIKARIIGWLGILPFAMICFSWRLAYFQFELWIDWVGTSQLRLFLSGIYWVLLFGSTTIWWVVQIPCWILKKGTLVKSAIALAIFWMPASGILWVVMALTCIWLYMWSLAIVMEEECNASNAPAN